VFAFRLAATAVDPCLKQISLPPILVPIITHFHSLRPYLRFPLGYSLTDRRMTKTPILRSIRASDSFTLPHGSSAFLPADMSSASSRSHSAFPEAIRTMKRLSREHAEQHLTISNTYEFLPTAVVNTIRGLMTCYTPSMAHGF